MRITTATQLAALDFAKADGLLPAIVQHFITGEVLMLGYADEEALRRCLDTQEVWLHSRSRQQYWHKGATSGNTQRILSIHGDCDRDAVLILVEPRGPACHTGSRSCFEASPFLAELADVVAARATADPDRSYTARLTADENLRLKKLGEEAVELAIACAAGDENAITEEAADLFYHVLVACNTAGVTLESVLARLATRCNA